MAEHMRISLIDPRWGEGGGVASTYTGEALNATGGDGGAHARQPDRPKVCVSVWWGEERGAHSWESRGDPKGEGRSREHHDIVGGVRSEPSIF